MSTPKPLLRDFRFMPGEPSLGDKFPEFDYWTVVAVSKVGNGYPYIQGDDVILRVKHWTCEMYVHIRPPRAKRGTP